MTIRDVYQDCIALSIVPARVFEFISLCLFAGNGGLSGADKETAQQIVGEAKSLEELLRGSIGKAFAAEQADVPRDLDAQREETLAMLSDIIKRLRRLMDDAMSDQDALRAAFDINRNALVPLMGATLAAFEAAVAKFEQETSKDQRSVINSAVSEIDDINSVINLISVNASVEAARAGEAGRGFAVIASEIQTLSQRSKQAVHDIRSRLR